MVMKAVAHIELEQLVSDILYKKTKRRLVPTKVKKNKTLVFHYVIIYGRRLRVLIRKCRNFFYGRLKNHPKWLAVATSKKEVLAKIMERLCRLFEKSSITNDFQNWNSLTGEQL